TNTATSDGVHAIDVSGWTLSALTLTATSAQDGNFDLTVTSTANDGGDLNSNTATIHVAVAEHADQPSLTVADASGTEDSPIALSISTHLVDAAGAADADETLTTTISGAPAG